MGNPYEQDLDRNAANHQPLTPLTYLERAARTYPDHIAIIHGLQRISYRDFWRRSLKFASALQKRGIRKGDTVTVMLSNTPPMLEAHFGVPMTKAVLHSLNTRLDAAVIAFQLDHAETKILIVDREFSGVVRQALDLAKVKPLVIDYRRSRLRRRRAHPRGERIGTADYEDFVAGGDEDFAWSMPDDEWDAISLNYTSGTTGNPKGVVYHHRGAALMAYTNTIHAGMAKHAGLSLDAADVPLQWLVFSLDARRSRPGPMSACAGCGRRRYTTPSPITASPICAARPVVMSVLINATPDEDKRTVRADRRPSTPRPPRRPKPCCRAWPMPALRVTHLYGLTETYGPAVINEWHERVGQPRQAASAAPRRRGRACAMPRSKGITVMDPETMTDSAGATARPWARSCSAATSS